MSKKGRHSGDEPRTRRIAIRLTEKEFADVNQYAKENDRTLTQTLMDGFEELKKKKT